jgi:4-alpha-glucanotransferase
MVALAGVRSFQVNIGAAGARHGRHAPAAQLMLEDGRRLDVRLSKSKSPGVFTAHCDQPLPLGVHEIAIGVGPRDIRGFVLAKPKSLSHIVAQAGRRLAVFLPLYSVTPGGPWGVGSYSDLRELCEWAQRTAGALVGTLPLFAAFLDRPCDPSPYAPVSRLMWNELFVDPRETPEWTSPEVRKATSGVATVASARQRSDSSLVDYRRAWMVARRQLSAMASAARASPRRWAAIIGSINAETTRYAEFRAAVDATGTTWQHWPAAWRAGHIDHSTLRPHDIDMYLYAQSIAARQIGTLRGAGAGRSPLYLDLPVGVHAGGFDTLTRPDLFLHGISAGAPPDELNAAGQIWGFPPMHPAAGRADGYAHLRAVLRRMLSVAGVLRIDHVMGLYRMYCVPEGMSGRAGAYVRYPQEELFAIVMIEAARAGAMVVGEDLGTVPPEVRTLMHANGLLGMHVQQFCFDPTSPTLHTGTAHSLASLNTHDTPTFAGFWNADDVTMREALNHTDEANAARERQSRTVTRRAIAAALKQRRLPSASSTQVAMSLMRLQALGPSPITLVNLEDLWGERRPQNVPGTSTQHPNWQRKAAKSLRAILTRRDIRTSLAALRAERQSAEPRPQSRPRSSKGLH